MIYITPQDETTLLYLFNTPTCELQSEELPNAVKEQTGLDIPMEALKLLYEARFGLKMVSRPRKVRPVEVTVTKKPVKQVVFEFGFSDLNITVNTKEGAEATEVQILTQDDFMNEAAIGGEALYSNDEQGVTTDELLYSNDVVKNAELTDTFITNIKVD